MRRKDLTPQHKATKRIILLFVGITLIGGLLEILGSQGMLLGMAILGMLAIAAILLSWLDHIYPFLLFAYILALPVFIMAGISQVDVDAFGVAAVGWVLTFVGPLFVYATASVYLSMYRFNPPEHNDLEARLPYGYFAVIMFFLTMTAVILLKEFWTEDKRVLMLVLVAILLAVIASYLTRVRFKKLVFNESSIECYGYNKKDYVELKSVEKTHETFFAPPPIRLSHSLGIEGLTQDGTSKFVRFGGFPKNYSPYGLVEKIEQWQKATEAETSPEAQL